MRPPAHTPVPPLLLLLSCPRGIYRCVQLLLLLLLLLILSGGTARAGRGRRATSVSPDLLPPWLVRQQVTNMSREFHDAWGTCGAKAEPPHHCDGHHRHHHGRGHCGSVRSEEQMQRVCEHRSGRARAQHLKRLHGLHPPNCGPWTNTSHWEQEVAESPEKCFRTMRHLLHMDKLAGAAVCRFSHILARYDCFAATTFVGRHLSPHHSMCALCQVRRRRHPALVCRSAVAGRPLAVISPTTTPQPWSLSSPLSCPLSPLSSLTSPFNLRHPPTIHLSSPCP